MGNETIIPAIPSPKLDVVKSASAMKEIHEVREGLRGDPLDRFVSVRDMLYDDDILQRLDARYYTEDEITATFSDYLLKDGTRALTGNWDAGSFKITAEQLESDVATGTAPLIVASTTKVDNLNADLLDGNHAAAFAAAAHNHAAGDITSGTFADARIAQSNVTQHEGAIDHGSIAGLADDDHSQYHNNARGDARYLYKENTDAFTPDADYEPATKKYVDDQLGAESGYAFKTITGITNDVVADQQADTLTLSSANSKLTIVGTAATDTITFTVVEGQIVHDNLSGVSTDNHHAQLHAASHNSGGGDALNHDSLAGFVLNEHINHTSVTITTTEGIQGGGDISANRTFKLDINGLTADAAPDGASDYVATYDASAGVHKKVLLNNLPGGGAHTHDGETLQLDGINSDGGAFSFTTTGDITFNSKKLKGLAEPTLTSDAATKNYVDNAVGVGGHTHDGETLQLDGVNSDGGAFSFSTTGAVSFNQDVNVISSSGNIVLQVQADDWATLKIDADTGNVGSAEPSLRFLINSVEKWRLSVDNTSSDKFHIGEGTTDRLTILSGGYVGIGTNSPSAPLDVQGSAVFNEAGNDCDFRVETNNNANALMVDGGKDTVGIGGAASASYRLYVTVPNGQSTIDTAIYGVNNSDATTSRGVTAIAGGGSASSNEGCWARASFGSTHNWHFADYAGNYSDSSGWHDVSDPARKDKIRNVTKKDQEVFYALLDKLHLKGYYLKAEKEEPNWKAPERFGLLSNDPDLPDFLSSKDKKGMSPGKLATFLVGVVQHQKEIIAEQEKRIAKLERRQ